MNIAKISAFCEFHTSTITPFVLKHIYLDAELTYTDLLSNGEQMFDQLCIEIHMFQHNGSDSCSIKLVDKVMA